MLKLVRYYFADALEDVDEVFEVADVVDGEGELEVAEMAWTVYELLFASAANSVFVSHSLNNYIQLEKTIKIPVSGQEARSPSVFGFSHTVKKM